MKKIVLLSAATTLLAFGYYINKSLPITPISGIQDIESLTLYEERGAAYREDVTKSYGPYDDGDGDIFYVITESVSCYDEGGIKCNASYKAYIKQ